LKYVEQKRELDEEEAERRYQSETDVINQLISSYSGVASAYSQMVQGRLNEDINRLKSSAAYENASMEQREIMEQKIRDKHHIAAKRAAGYEKAANVATSIMNTAAAVTKALGVNPVLAGLVGALGAAQTALIMATPTGYAKGGDFVTSGPQMIAVGDNPGGRERVQVTPLSSPNIDGPSGGGITINISAPLVDETVIDSIIPAIEKAQRLNLA